MPEFDRRTRLVAFLGCTLIRRFFLLRHLAGSQFSWQESLVKRFAPIVVLAPLLVLTTPFVVPPAAGQSAPQGVNPLTIESIFAPGGLTGRGPETMEWSPDGTILSFVQRDAYGEKGELWNVDAATAEKKVLNSATAVQFTSAPDPSGDPKFSPDGSHVSYLRKRNLYVRPLNGKDEKQLTKDKDDNLFNGGIDWVYAEELAVRSNYFWSPDNKEIVFLHMDETKVPTYPITDWMPTHPTVDYEKYPKVGDPNPVVKLGIVKTDNAKIRWISLTDDSDTYIPRFGWVRAGLLWAEVLNRTQDRMDLYFVDANSGKSAKVLTETSPGAWINVNDDFRILKSGDRFLWSSWRDGHTHLYLYSFDRQNPLAAEAKLEGQLTQGDFEMLGLQAVDDAAGLVLFAANKDDPRQHHLFSVKLDGSGMQALTHDEGMHFGEFSDDGKHYANTYSNVLAPPQLSVCAVGASCSPVWQARSVSAYGLSAPKFLEFKADDGSALYGRLLLPADSPAGGKTPLIVNIYGGPAAQMVLKGWGGSSELFDQILIRKGFALFAVDNRGTPGRDRKFQTAIRHEFGAIELKDQLTALDELFAQYPQLDRERMAIWGWSNGGSMTIYAMTHSEA